MNIKQFSNNLLIKLNLLDQFAQDFESDDQVIHEFINAITTKFILTNLDKKDRLALYSILEINKDDKAISFIKEKIPYLNKKLYLEIKDRIGEILK